MTVTPLTLYTTNTNSTTLSNGRLLVTGTGAGSTNAITTKCGNTSTGYGQVYSQGDSAGWGNAGTGYGSIQAPNGKGFVLEAATLNLVGQQIQAGNWTQLIRSKTSVGTLSVDMYVPVYKYNTNTLAYTLLFTLSFTGQTVTSSSTNFTFAASNQSAWTPATNEVIYYEVWYNITANNTGNAAATVGIVEAISATQGNSQSTTLTTPGYQAAGGGGSGGNPYGITIGSSAPNVALAAAAITDMQALGIGHLRYQVGWNLIDTSGGTAQNVNNYVLTALDSAVSQCNAASISICLTIFHAPAQFQSGGNPLTPSYTATFASQLASRYDGAHGHGTVDCIEVGNEDYDNSAGTSATPLVATMKAVYPAVKAVKSSILVSAAALLQRNSSHYTSFMETFLNPSTGAYIGGVLQADALNFHYYTGIPTSGGKPVNLDPTVDIPSWNGGAGLPSITTAWGLINNKMVAYGVNVPVWLTETGMAINGNPGRSQYIIMSQAQAWTYLQAITDSCRISNVVDRIYYFTLGYYTGYPAPNYRDGMSLVQGTSGSPTHTTAYTSLAAYTVTYPVWSSGGGSGGGGGTVPPFTTTVFLTGQASSTLSSANTLYTTGGGGVNNVNADTALGTATGWGELVSQGTVSAWAAGGAEPAPTGKGFFLDSSVLVGNSLLAGTYTASLRLSTTGTGAANITANLYCRLYRYDTVALTYTLIARCVLAGQTVLANNPAVFNPVFTTVATTPFATGQVLYLDLPQNVLTNTGASTQKLRLNDESTETTTLQGLTTAQVVTPGYATTATPLPPPPGGAVAQLGSGIPARRGDIYRGRRH